MPQISKNCNYCNKDFFIKTKERNRKYCSRKCADASRVIERIARNCNECNQEFVCIKTSKKKFCNRTCAKIHFEKHFTHSEEAKKEMSRTRKGRISWNKGLTHEDDCRILSGENSPTYGKTFCTKENNPQWANNIKKATKGKINLGDSNAMKRPEVREKVSLTRKKMMEDPELRKTISEKTKKAWFDGKFDNVSVGQCKWFDHTKSNGEIIKVQGTWELAFVKWLDINNISYISHRGRIKYIDEAGNNRNYYPDFYINDWKCWVDIKNDYHWKLQKQKFECIKISNPDIKIDILNKEKLKHLGVLI